VGVPGWLVPQDNPVALAGALQEWLTHSDVRGQMRGLAAQRRSSLPTWEQTVDQVARALTKAKAGVAL
jgi:glycosyltransferase involved in cell wall biosynthesis